MVTSLVNVILTRDEEKNALDPIEFKLFGNEMLVSSVQSSKALTPILLIVEGTSTLVRLLHLAKAKSPIPFPMSCKPLPARERRLPLLFVLLVTEMAVRPLE